MSRRKDPSYEGVPEEIERLADLRDKGVISDKDFQNLKKQLIKQYLNLKKLCHQQKEFL